jgi:erythromycin esterase
MAKIFLAALMLVFLNFSAARADLSGNIDDVYGRAFSLKDASDLDPLIESIGERKYVLLGEASHGTSDYYRWRYIISRRLIEEKGFSFIAVEGDWSAAYELNRYVKDLPGAAGSAEEALHGFVRWPQWMWRNEETVELVEWLRDHNKAFPEDERVGIYGVDLYAMIQSIEEVVTFFGSADPEAVEDVKEKYSFILSHGNDPREYAVAVAHGRTERSNGAEEVVRLLRTNADKYMEIDAEAYFNAKQNAMVVKNAERHYVSSVYRGPASWNYRVDHFKGTFGRLAERYGPEAKGIVWAHNTHVGDARATSMSGSGMYNIGQLIREARGREDVFIVGFGTYEGQVIAGESWGAPMRVMRVPPAARGSLEEILSRVPMESFFLMFDEKNTPDSLRRVLGHRAKGVTYNPRSEEGNYVPTIVTDRYDAFIFIKETSALRVLFGANKE